MKPKFRQLHYSSTEPFNTVMCYEQKQSLLNVLLKQLH